MSARTVTVMLVAGVFAHAGISGAQQARPGARAGGTCNFDFRSQGAPLQIVTLPSGQQNWYLGERSTLYCRQQDITVIADSAEYFGDARILHLIGNVDYREPRLKLTSRRVTYWLNDEHLRAEGNVNSTLPSGTTMTGPEIDYYRAAANIRARSRMIAPGRPTITLSETSPGARPGEPTTIVANTVVMDADSLVYATGRVVITRTDVVARGDSAFMDSGSEFARLMRTPQIDGKGERPFTLTGSMVDLHGRNRQLTRVVSMGRAKAVSRDVTLTSDTLDLRMAEGKMERSYAWGRSRARAVSAQYDIVADSLDIRMPGQRVNEVRALGGALAQSNPDSLKIRSTEKDWLRGDYIIARFDTATRADTGGGPRIRDLVANGNARSYYQVAAREGPSSRPGVNYVTGKVITLVFENQVVRTVAIREQSSGVYLEPSARSDTARAGRDAPRPRPQQRPPIRGRP